MVAIETRHADREMGVVSFEPGAQRGLRAAGRATGVLSLKC